MNANWRVTNKYVDPEFDNESFEERSLFDAHKDTGVMVRRIGVDVLEYILPGWFDFDYCDSDDWDMAQDQAETAYQQHKKDNQHE